MTGGGDSNIKQILAFVVLMVAPPLFRFLKMSPIDLPSSDFIANIIRENINERKNTKIKKDDFIDFLAEAMKEYQQSGDKDGLTDDEIEQTIISNGLLLFFAGNDTTSSGLSVASHFLAKNQDIQVFSTLGGSLKIKMVMVE